MIKFLDEISKIWSERGAASTYGTLLLWLIIWNWKFLFILFLEDAADITGLRSQYAVNHHFYISGDIFVDSFVNFSLYLLPPLILTYLAIWQLPKLVGIAHAKSLSFEFQRKRQRLDEATEYARYKAAGDTTRAAAVVEQKAAERIVEKALTEQDKWKIELEEVMTNKNDLAAITVARRIIYEQQGYFSTSISDKEGYISPDLLSRIDTLGIAEIESSQLQPTQKGKFFLRQLEKGGYL